MTARAWALMALAMALVAVLNGAYDVPHVPALAAGTAAGAALGLGIELGRGLFSAREP